MGDSTRHSLDRIDGGDELRQPDERVKEADYVDEDDRLEEDANEVGGNERQRRHRPKCRAGRLHDRIADERERLEFLYSQRAKAKMAPASTKQLVIMRILTCRFKYFDEFSV